MSPWAEPVLIALAALLLAALTGWGVALQRMTARLERDHPQAFATLRARSKRKAARMAVVAELQRSLTQGDPLPDGAAADRALARLAAREKALRQALLVLALALFGVFALA